MQDAVEKFRQSVTREIEALGKAPPGMFSDSVEHFWDWLEQMTLGEILLGNLEQVADEHPRASRSGERVVERIAENNDLQGLARRPYLGRIAFLWAISQGCRGRRDQDELRYDIIEAFYPRPDLQFSDFVERHQYCGSAYVGGVVRPIVNYLVKCLETRTWFAGILRRYKQRVEWFEKEDLFEAVSEAEGDENYSSTYEEIVADHLYMHLWDKMVDFEKEPVSASGRCDIVVGTHGEFVLDVKLLRETPDANTLRRGFEQVREYKNDYDARHGYLAVFVTGEKALKPISNRGEFRLPKVNVQGEPIYFVAVDINPNRETASKKSAAWKPDLAKLV